MANVVLDKLEPELHPAPDPGAGFRRLVIATGSFAGAFFLAGFSEQWGLTQIVVLLLLSLILRKPLIWLALLGALLGYGVVAVAPGNAVRTMMLAAINAPRRTIIEAVQYALYRDLLFIGQTVITKFYAVLIAVCGGYIAGGGRQMRHRARWLIGFVVGGYILMAISLFPVGLISGGYEFRHFTIATFILMACSASIGYIVACRN